MNVDERGVYFFDTSAFVKRYHMEAGTDVVDAAFAGAGVAKLISDLSVIEFYSAFARKTRTGVITMEDFQRAVRVMSDDIDKGVVQLVFLGDEDKEVAMSLLESYGVTSNLRTLDSLQLAVMKEYGPSEIDAVYCADQQFAAVIEAEGFSVIDPANSANHVSQ